MRRRKELAELRALADSVDPTERAHCIAQAIDNVAAAAEPDAAVLIAAALMVAARHTEPAERAMFVEAAALAFDSHHGGRS